MQSVPPSAVGINQSKQFHTKTKETASINQKGKCYPEHLDSDQVNLNDQEASFVDETADVNLNGNHSKSNSSSHYTRDQLRYQPEVLVVTEYHYTCALWAFRCRMKCVVAMIPG